MAKVFHHIPDGTSLSEVISVIFLCVVSFTDFIAIGMIVGIAKSKQNVFLQSRFLLKHQTIINEI